MCSRQGGFPVTAFRQFAVAGDQKNAAGAVAFLRGQRQPHRNRQTVAQRAGVELDARRFLPHRVAGEMGIGMLVGLQPLDREEADFRQDAVVAAHGVAFRLDVDIALRVVEPVRRDVKDAEIERG